MYINIYKASSYSYIDRNFEKLEDAKEYLKIEQSESLNFKTNDLNELSVKYGDWTISIKDGNMPNEGEGYVSMLEESGALDV